MQMQLPIHVPEKPTESFVSDSVKEEQIIVSDNDSCVPDSHIKFMVMKTAEILKNQGIPCCECNKTKYILSKLSACKDILNIYTLNIICPFGNSSYQFELSISQQDNSVPVLPAQIPAAFLKGGE